MLFEMKEVRGNTVQASAYFRGVQWVVQVVRPNHLFWGGSPAERDGWVKGGKKKKRKEKRKGSEEIEKGGKKEEGKKEIREINEDNIKHVLIGTGSSPLSPVSRAICM